MSFKRFIYDHWWKYYGVTLLRWQVHSHLHGGSRWSIRQSLKSGDCRGLSREGGPKGHRRMGKLGFLWRCFVPPMAQSPSPHRPLEQLWSLTPLRTGARSAGLTDSPDGSSAPGAAGAPVGQCSSLLRRERTEGGFVQLWTPVLPHPG